MVLPRCLLISLSDRPSRDSPARVTSPPTWAFSDSRPMTAIEVTDLPDPDSPTVPSTCPGYRSKLTPRTACTVPASVGERPLRDRTLSTGFAVRPVPVGVRGWAVERDGARL